MKPLQRARLTDSRAYAEERARFWGREMIVAMAMGLEQRAYDCAGIAFRWAVSAGYARETE